MLLTLTILAALGAADIKVNVAQPALKVDVAQPAVKTSTLMSGLIFWAPLTTNWTKSTTAASDRSSTHDTCTLQGAAAFSSTGVDLNGTSQYISCTDQAVYSPTDGAGTDKPMSWSIWAYMDDATSFRFFTKDNGGASREFYIITGATDKLSALVFQDGSKYLVSATDAAITGYEGSWMLLAVTYTGSELATGLTIYLNGAAPAQTKTTTGAYTGTTNTAVTMTLGYLYNATYSNGRLRDARMWNRALSQAEITELYVGGPTP